MKKFLAVFVCVLMCVSFSPMALAANLRDISFETSLASRLKELGLFLGVGENDDGTADFDLGREPSRAEALTMLVRALGKGVEAEAYPKTHPFSDVPAWADGYVSYACDNGLTKGVSDTLFGAESAASAEMYLTFMLRALGYSGGDGGAYTWDAPQALAASCGILPAQVDGTDFLRADVVEVTCAALYANIKGTQTTLQDRLVSEGAFTQEQFDAAFPDDPFATERLVDSRVSEVIAARVLLGMVDDNVYATECHIITDIAEVDGVLTVSALVCYHDQHLPKDNVIPYWDSSGTVAPWLIELDADTLQLKSCRLAYELMKEGFALTDCFSEETLAALSMLRMPMRDVCKMETQMQIDSGAIAYRQPTYEEALAKATASLSEITQTLEADPCTILLGKPDGQIYYKLCLIFKPGSAVGEGETETIWSSSQGDLRLSEDGSTLYYSYHYENRAVCEGLPPTGASTMPESGTCSYTVDLNTRRLTLRIFSD